jgi:long-chain fatty acid transport protein
MLKATTVFVATCAAYSLLWVHEAEASTDLPGQYDARALAIGGTGPSYIENGASVFLNPATLDGIETFAGTLAIAPIRTQLTSPVAGPGSSVESDSPFFPLFFVGGGYRLSEQFVVGAALYPTAGFGATYDGAAGGGNDLSLSLAQFEASPAISFKVTDGLSLGLAYRFTYTRQQAKQPGPTEVEMTGISYFGLHAGAYYRPSDEWHFGLTYRSRVDSSLSGTAEMLGQEFDAESEFAAPHRFRLGASYSPGGTSLMLAADVKYLLYADANESIDTTIETPAGNLTVSQRLEWENVLAFGLGAEYWIVPEFAVRGGYSLSQSATPDHTATPFTASPGMIHTGHLGAGLKLSSLELDLGGLYSLASKEVEGDPSAPPPGGPVPGSYDMDVLLVSLSATYRR